MGFDFRMPNIMGTDREQLQQIRSYLYQFIPQLQFALNAMDNASGASVTQVSTNTVQKSTAKPTNTVDTEVSFNAIKSLIIKSAEIVDAYYEEINSRLSSEYVAQSDFGTYTEKTDAIEKRTASFDEKTYERFCTVESDMEELSGYKYTKGYIKTGIIVDSLSKEEAEKYNKTEGESLIGVEIGDTTDDVFRSYARFTPNRLSFFDNNGTEVAYISNYMLYISCLEILSKFKIGGILDKVMENGDVVTKWVGVGGDA